MQPASLSLILAAALTTTMFPFSGRAETLRVTMDEVARRTLATYEDPAGLELARAQLERSRAWLPSNPFFGAGGGHNSATQVPPNYLFFLSQEFEIAGQRKARIAAALRGIEQATWERKSATLNLEAVARASFIHALASSTRVTLAQQHLDMVRELAAGTEPAKGAEELERIEHNIAVVQVVRAERELAAARQGDEDALDHLRLLMGLEAERAIELRGALRADAATPPPPAVLIERARQERPDLRALQEAAQVAELEVTVQKKARIPNVTLFGSVSRFEDDTILGGDIGIPIPLFQRGAAEVQEAITERQRALREIRQLERDIANEILDARRSAVIAAGNLLALQREILPRLQENVDLERRLYDRGEVGIADLLGLQIDLLTARREQVDAMEIYNSALIEIERVVGGPVETLAAPSRE